MARRGNRPLQKRESITDAEHIYCMRCNKIVHIKCLYSSDSDLHASVCKIPYCKMCLDDMYHKYLDRYKAIELNKQLYRGVERLAIERMCAVLDLYYSDDIFDLAIKDSKLKPDTTLMALYIKNAKLYQYRKKDYITTFEDRLKNEKEPNSVIEERAKLEDERAADIEAAIKIFGRGFDDDDYLYLYEQYADWTTRHECETKAQEEVFKRICFKQLEILKATRRGDDTKDLDMTFQKLLETAKLQPKQNKGETVADAQTFGTLIDKWENTRPIPEIDEELRDVDRIGQYIDVFFKGHLAKMMGLKNGLSNQYTQFMKKYTVDKPEYKEDEDGEALFDAIFGNGSIDN